MRRLPRKIQALPEARKIPAAHFPFIVVAELAGETVGFASVLRNNDDFRAELEDLFVAPAVWRKGVGLQLIRETERRTVALSARFLRVVASERAHLRRRRTGETNLVP
jgi:GNAT superfamily N-acetyltransferase